ncbi:MBG domain-containing protein [Pedobacter boryungensis]|uniref:MBG domain-containing protein n=1 Tax=Pedobacter boryungensis TaxID=869962 RepID=UPI001C20A3BE|nr:MBG domain-containing protein [Pedobacter boryungensis]
MIIGDIDGDERPDIVGVRASNGELYVYKNIVPIPTITSFTPNSGPIGTQVNIKGKGFNTIANQNLVFFGGAIAKVEKVISSNELIVSAPIGSDHSFVSLTNLASGLTAGTTEAFDITYTSSGPLTFKPEVGVATGQNPWAVAAKDLNKDGLIDFVVANEADNDLTVYINQSTTGAVSFKTAIHLKTGASPKGVKIADLDNDGLPDIAVVNSTDNTLKVFHNTTVTSSKNPQVTFAASSTLTTGGDPVNLEIADFDGDGKFDVATENSTGSLSVFKNSSVKGQIKFNQPSSVSISPSAFNLSIGDFDKDGKIDLATTSNVANVINVLKNTSANGLIGFSVTTPAVTTPLITSLLASDSNNDGNLDLIYSDASVNGLIVKFGNGDLTFGPEVKTNTNNPSGNIGLSAGDVDGDGKVELAVGGNNFGNHFIFKNASGNSFTQAYSASTSNTRFNALEDVDADGKLDFISLYNGKGELNIKLNDQIVPIDIQTLPATNIVADGARLNGKVRANTGDVNVAFEFSSSPDMSGGGTLNATSNATVKAGSGFVDSYVDTKGWDPVTFYYRIVATAVADGTQAKGAILSVDIPAQVVSITATSPNPVIPPLTTVDYKVNFSGDINGLTPANFSLTTTGAVSGASVVDVQKDPMNVNSWYVLVNVGSGGDGTLTLNLANATGLLNTNLKPLTLNVALPFAGDTYTIDAGAPAAPIGLVANPGDGLVKLTWAVNNESDLASYEIYGGTSANPTTLLTSIAVGGALSYTDINLTNGTTYFYRITAKDGAGNESAYSNEVSGTPKAGLVPKLDQTITFAPLSDVMYGDAGFDLPAKSDQGLDITYTSPSPAVVITNKNHVEILHAGKATIYADQGGDATYNEAGQVSQVLDILPRPITVQATATGKVAGSGADPVLSYYVAQGQFYNGDLATNVFKGTPQREVGELPGIYKIHQGTVVSNGDYELTFIEDDFTITPAAGQTVSIPQGLSANPGDALVKLTWIANPELNLAGYDVYGGTSANPTTLLTNVSAGTQSYTDMNLTNGTTYHYRIVAKLTDGTVSAYSNEVSGTPQPGQALKIDQTITFGPLADKIYGDADFDLTATAGSGQSVTYTISDNSVATVTGSTVHILHVGTVTISADQSGDNFYNAAGQVSRVLTIAQKQIDVVADAQSKVVNAQDPALTYSYSPSLVPGDGFSGSLSRVAGENVGSYAIDQYTLSLGSDYKINYTGAQFVITAAPVQNVQSISFNALPVKTYGDADFDAGATASSGLPVSYSSSDNSVATIVNGKVHILKAGTVTIYADQSGNGNYTAAVQAGQLLIIKQAPLQLSADAKTKVYGTNDPTFTYVLTSGTLLAGDAISGTLIRAPGENVGAYAIGLGSLTAGANYSIALVPANLTITTAAITVKADPMSKFIGDADPVLTYTYSPILVGSDSFSGSLDRAPGESLGTYAIGKGTLSAGSNYMITFVPSTLSIGLKSAANFKLDANNILTPNGDGKNDKLVIKGLDQYPDAKLTIVDREGRVVYQSTHYQNDFDGTYNGKPLSDNTYYYIVDFGKSFGRIRGFITIIN